MALHLDVEFKAAFEHQAVWQHTEREGVHVTCQLDLQQRTQQHDMTLTNLP